MAPVFIRSKATHGRGHMPRRTLFLITSALLACALLAPAAPAQNSNANCGNLDDPSFAGWTSHAQLGAALDRIERTSGGTVDVKVIGRSNRGRELYAARVGTGDRV